jgi:hypothetical protein
VIRGHRPSMADTMQRCEGGVDNTSAGSPSSVSDETDPAGIVLETRVVQACVAQDEPLTLSGTVPSRHGRFNQKDGFTSYPLHKCLRCSASSYPRRSLSQSAINGRYL